MFTGPNIVTDGLFLWIDAGNPKCFTSGSDTCKNLVTGNLLTGANGSPGTGAHSPTPSNFPEYNPDKGGIFDFSGGKGMNCEENLGYRSENTLSMWFFKNGSDDTEYFADARNDGGDWFLSNYGSANINYENTLEYNFGTSYDSSNPEFINRWLFLTVTSNSTESRLYLNGDLVTTASSLNENYGVNFRIGTRYTTSGQWDGYMGSVYAHDFVLSQKQIKQNFNAQKSRFGL